MAHLSTGAIHSAVSGTDANDRLGTFRAAPQDRFNAGQKLLFWLQSVAAVLLFASGVVLWFPSSVSRALHLAAILVHSTTAVVSLGAIIVHVYMGTAVVPGSFGAMIHGRVRRRWAEEHHPKWAREDSKH